jgi:hypothetical protein
MRKTLGLVRKWTNWYLIRELPWTSNLKEGAVVAVGEWALCVEKMTNGKEVELSQAETSERRNGDTPLGYSGRALPGKSSVNTVQHSTIEEAVFFVDLTYHH